MKLGVAWSSILSLVGCAGYPSGVEPVDGFELDRYLGTWFEIARLDHGFERGLSKVTAEYSLNDDGTVKSEQKISDTTGGLMATLGNSDFFGTAVAGPGDIDGDGLGDLVVGANHDDDGGAGRSGVFLGPGIDQAEPGHVDPAANEIAAHVANQRDRACVRELLPLHTADGLVAGDVEVR